MRCVSLRFIRVFNDIRISCMYLCEREEGRSLNLFGGLASLLDRIDAITPSLPLIAVLQTISCSGSSCNTLELLDVMELVSIIRLLLLVLVLFANCEMFHKIFVTHQNDILNKFTFHTS